MALFRFRQPPASASSSVKLVFLCVVCLVFLVTYRYILRTCAPRVPEQAPSMPTRPHSHLSSHVFTDSDLSRPVAHIDPDRINPETGLSAAVEAALEDPSSPVVSVHYGHPGPRRAKEWGVPSAPETLEKIISPSKDPNFYGVRYLTAPPKPSPPAPDPNSGPTQEELDAVAEMERKEALGSRLRKMAELTAKPRPPYVRTQPPEQYVAMCISVKNQHRDLAEWFKHHYHHLGIRKFYVMDDGSVPPLADNPDWGIPRDSIVFHHLTSKTRRSPDQRHNAYDRCARLYGSLHTWMAMLDADEYLEMTGGGSTIGGRKEKETLSSFLQDFEGSPDVGAVAVNQVIHTSSRLVTRPVSTRRSFTTCIQDQDDDHHGGGHNARTRRIVRTDRYVKAVGPSGTFVQLRNDSVTVGEDWDEVEGTTRSPVTRGRIAVHHYAVGSWQQFQDKVRRGNGLGGRTGQWFWDDVENLPSRRCDEMAKYEP